MKKHLIFQVSNPKNFSIPPARSLRAWLALALPSFAEVSLVFVEDTAAQALNQRFRQKDTIPNVLAFSLGHSPEGALLGDVVAAFPAVEREARLLGLPLETHLAHLLVHAALHLGGMDHEDEEGMLEMHERENRILHALGFPEPHPHSCKKNIGPAGSSA